MLGAADLGPAYLAFATTHRGGACPQHATPDFVEGAQSCLIHLDRSQQEGWEPILMDMNIYL
jgi:hypothetical protein